MLIYLKNPKHGVHICYNENDAKECEKNGWTRFNPDEKPKVVEKTNDGPIFTNAASTPRRGRPPKVTDDESTTD